MIEKEKKNFFIGIEHDMLDFWEHNETFYKLVKKNKDGIPFRFLDGPMTANNPMGIHHAWGRSVKDIFLRYKGMKGYSCHYRNGFDTQGLWVEVEVEKELGFKDKKDIEYYGMDNFTNRCINRIEKYSKIITSQSKRLGQWMDWNNSYFTHTDENITAIWHFLKICDKNGWIAEAHRPMPWCPRCGTSLSEHEMTGSHKDITHTALFAKLPIIDRDFDILVWTTTPWTLSANTALAVNPDLQYALVQCGEDHRPIVLAKSALSQLSGSKKVLQLLRGSDLVGLSYETFFPFLPIQKDLKHKIVPWNQVEANEGSGVVHIAPGCGAEDFELGKFEGLSEICPIDEDGRFKDNYGFLSGKSATEAAPLIFEALKNQGKLYKTHEYTHSYPICWRCKTEVLFRLVESWTIKTEEIKPKLLEASHSVKWEPSFAGKRMEDWLTNMGDWNISRKRFYGLPLPFYKCKKCGHLTVIGSKEELHDLGGKIVDSLPHLHRPWIDKVKIKCPVCGEMVERIPEVGDVWLDAGITPFSTLGYFKDRISWEKQFPLELVLEMNEQIRLWFYSLLFMSVTLTGKPPYERVITHGSVVQENGARFHKSGYMIKFDEACEEIGADTIRYMYAGANISSDLRFGYNLGDEARRKLLGFWNIYTFFMTYGDIDNPIITKESSNNPLDIWLINRINDFNEKARNAYEAYDTSKVINEFEVCIDDVSNWYVRTNRRRFWKDYLDSDKQWAYNSLYFAVKTICQIMAPITPFITEKIWQTMIKRFGEGEESVHLSAFPIPGRVHVSLLSQMESVRNVIAGAMKLRNENQLKVKQPLSSLYLPKAMEPVVEKYEDVVKEELNVKSLVFLDDFKTLSDEFLSLNFKTAGNVLKENLTKVKSIMESLSLDETQKYISQLKCDDYIYIGGFKLTSNLIQISSKAKSWVKILKDPVNLAINIEITPELKAEGYYRELLRNCQVLRKEAGFDVVDKANICFRTEDEYLASIINKFKDSIEKETLSTISQLNDYCKIKIITMDGNEVSILINK